MREHQCANRCPHIDPSEWTSGGIPCAENGKDLALDAPHCPGALARQSVAIEALRARRWWEQGQLRDLYREVPQVVIAAVEAADADLTAWRNERTRLLQARKGD